MFRMFSLDWFDKLCRPTIALAANEVNVNWKLGDFFSKTITGNTTFTFSNTKDGKAITFIVENLAAVTVDVAFPAGLYKDSTFDLKVESGAINTYTFMRSGNRVLGSYVSKMKV